MENWFASRNTSAVPPAASRQAQAATMLALDSVESRTSGRRSLR